MIKRPIDIQVGTISGNSGVYIAQQVVVSGISSHSKANSGIGAIGAGNLVYRNLVIVYDDDLIDTPIDDRDIHVVQQTNHPSPSQVTQVGFDSINVLTMSQNSGVFVGDVQITGMDMHSKINTAKGSVTGNGNHEMQNLNYVLDTDVIDAPIQDQDVKILTRY